MDEHPETSFANASPHECWKMVLRRLNEEIMQQRRLGKQGMPPLQNPNSINGLEMFGFLSPSIVQVSRDIISIRLSNRDMNLKGYIWINLMFLDSL